MQTVLIVLAVLILGVAAFFAVSSTRRMRERTGAIDRVIDSPDGQTLLVGLHEPTPILPPTLLPEHPRAEDLKNLKLPVGLRGYRADHVDTVIDTLSKEIERLHSLLEDADQQRVISATSDSQG